MNQILQPIAETIEEAKAASSDEFSKTNFKLPDDRLLKLKKMSAEADKALAGAVTPWTPTKVEEESDDHLEVLQTINRKYASVAISLEKCANFHRYHYESKPFENIVLTSKAIAEQYEKLIGLHVVFKDLMRIVNEHLGESGSLKNNNPNFREKFRERLLQLDQSMAVNNQDLSHLDLILNNHLSQNHALEIIRNAPEKWQQEISLA
ncbi:hypothetical protein C9993_10765 [Marinobacter sp. Z-F4-2]|nr:hypothetical protein C9993_10765 [Marinobacter sp. Z-F4-2]